MNRSLRGADSSGQLVRPDVLLGHSPGEVTVMVATGGLMAERGAVLLCERHGWACLSGPADQLKRLEDFATSRGVTVTPCM